MEENKYPQIFMDWFIDSGLPSNHIDTVYIAWKAGRKSVELDELLEETENNFYKASKKRVNNTIKEFGKDITPLPNKEWLEDFQNIPNEFDSTEPDWDGDV